jgi:hypothetical protein
LQQLDLLKCLSQQYDLHHYQDRIPEKLQHSESSGSKKCKDVGNTGNWRYTHSGFGHQTDSVRIDHHPYKIYQQPDHRILKIHFSPGSTFGKPAAAHIFTRLPRASGFLDY